jgi:hypothetical protein
MPILRGDLVGRVFEVTEDRGPGEICGLIGTGEAMTIESAEDGRRVQVLVLSAKCPGIEFVFDLRVVDPGSEHFAPVDVVATYNPVDRLLKIVA